MVDSQLDILVDSILFKQEINMEFKNFFNKQSNQPKGTLKLLREHGGPFDYHSFMDIFKMPESVVDTLGAEFAMQYMG